jgi:hypothetical protein
MSWFSKAAKIGGGWAVNPILGSTMAGKEVMGGVNKVMGRGYETNEDKLKEIQDLYTKNEKNNPYAKNYDPRLRQYQMSALNRLQGIAGSDKLDAQSQAQLNEIRRKEGQLEKGSREAIMQNAAERGASSSSTGNLMAQLNEPTRSIRAYEPIRIPTLQRLQQKRALDALYGSINTAEGVNQQDMQRAQANDLFNRYNLSGKAGVFGDQGRAAIDKAGQQNAFWGGILDKGAGLLTGGASSVAGGAIGGAPQASGGASGLQAYNSSNPFSKKPSLTNYDWENVYEFNPGHNPIL